MTANALSAMLDSESFLLEIALFAQFFIRIALNVLLKLEAVPFVFTTPYRNIGLTPRTYV